MKINPLRLIIKNPIEARKSSRPGVPGAPGARRTNDMAASAPPEAFGNLSKKVVNLSDKAVNLSEMAWNLSENRKARRSPRRDGNIGRLPPESKGFF